MAMELWCLLELLLSLLELVKELWCLFEPLLCFLQLSKENL